MTERHALACFLRGLGLSLSKPSIAASLWLIQLLLSTVLILPISNSLHDLLDDSVAGSRMVAKPESGWWETVQRGHPDLFGNFGDLTAGLLTPEGVRSQQLAGLRGIGATAVSLAFLAVVLHAFALGGVFGTVREPKASLMTFGREGMRRFPAFLVFTLAALAAAGAAYRWIYLETGEALRGRVANLDSEGKALAVTALRVLALLLALAAIKLVADSVRAVWVARPDLPPISRFFAGIASALGRPARLSRRPRVVRARDRRPLPRLALARSVRRRGGPIRARAAHPDAAGLRLRPPVRQGGLLRRCLRGPDARAVAGILLRAGARRAAARLIGPGRTLR